MIVKITRAYIRHYSDNGQTVAYVEWIDDKGKSGRTEGKQNGLHIRELLKRARREGLTVEREQW